jgi:hypothetical protein
VIDRDRFFVTHDQKLVGNNLDFTADTGFFGMENRFAAQLQASRNWITFVQEGNPNDFPFDFSPLSIRAQASMGRNFRIPASAGSLMSPARSRTASRSRLHLH